MWLQYTPANFWCENDQPNLLRQRYMLAVLVSIGSRGTVSSFSACSQNQCEYLRCDKRAASDSALPHLRFRGFIGVK
jgi:hypothetical protein